MDKMLNCFVCALVFISFSGPIQANCPSSGIVNSETFQSLDDAVDWVKEGATPCTLFVSNNFPSIENVVVPEYVELVFTRGGNLIAKLDASIEIWGPVTAPDDQIIFDGPPDSFKFHWTGPVIANWWSGDDIGERWNNMRSSLHRNRQDELDGKKPGPSHFKIVGKHYFSTPFNITGFRGFTTTIDFSAAELIAQGIGCHFRKKTVTNRAAREEEVLRFESEFASDPTRCAVLIVESTNSPDEWMISGYDDNGQFKSELIRDSSHELWMELKKEPRIQSKNKILDLATAEVGRTRTIFPALDMTNSVGLRIKELKLAGDPEEVSDVGVLLAREAFKRNAQGELVPSTANAGNHMFYGAQISGHWNIATIYNVESEVNHFIGGNFNNGSPNDTDGRYVLFFGQDNPDSVRSRYVIGTPGVSSTATNQNLTNVHVSGFAKKGGLYLRGFSNMRIHQFLSKNGGIGPQIVLDTSLKNISGVEISRHHSEGKVNTKPSVGLEIKGGKDVGNLLYDHVSDGASDHAVNIVDGTTVRFSDFRINSQCNFKAEPGVVLEQVRIEMNPANVPSYQITPVILLELASDNVPADIIELLKIHLLNKGCKSAKTFVEILEDPDRINLTDDVLRDKILELAKMNQVVLGESFSGEIHMANPDEYLVPPISGQMEALVYDKSLKGGGSAPRLRLLENSQPTLLLESTGTSSTSSQSKIRFRNCFGSMSDEMKCTVLEIIQRRMTGKYTHKAKGVTASSPFEI